MKAQQGFTLVEMAIVLIIFGLVFSTVFLGLRLYTDTRAEDITIESINESHLAMFEFRLIFNRYPCPADPTLPSSNPNYGRENCNAATSGVVSVAGFRDADNADRDNDPTTGRDNVLIGAVPFRTILDPNNDTPTGDNTAYDKYVERFAFDGWGNNLTYAVTENLATAGQFSERGGAIEVTHENTVDVFNDDDASLLGERGTAHLVILSHGANGKGAYTKEGNLVENCAVGAQKQDDIDNGVLTGPDETTNCQFTDAIFLSGLKNDTRYDFNDDFIKFMTVGRSSLWEYTGLQIDDQGTDDPDDDIQISKVANTNGGNVGIGNTSPSERLHIDGEVQAFEVHAVRLCDEGGNDCMDPEAIAGELDDMQCPEGFVVTQIEENSVSCSNPFDGTSLSGTCPAGTFLRGVSSLNGLICE